jgi:hypothetical protein
VFILKPTKIMKKKAVLPNAFLLFLLSGAAFKTHAQISLTGQVRTRTEYRNGTGTLKLKSNDAAFFTSQRTRLTANFKTNRIIMQAALQDVRVWGQDASTINNADGSRLGLHEGWAELVLANKKDTSFKNAAVEYFSVKAGRQEIIYDDSRLIGNLDWLQQARRHDAVILNCCKTDGSSMRVLLLIKIPTLSITTALIILPPM